MPQFEVGVIIMADRATVLLARHADTKGWEIPTGFVNDKESAKDAAQRIANNVAGVQVEPRQSLFFCEQIEPTHRVALFCLAVATGDTGAPFEPSTGWTSRWADVRELAKIQQEDGIDDFSAQAFLKFSDYLRSQAAAAGGGRTSGPVN